MNYIYQYYKNKKKKLKFYNILFQLNEKNSFISLWWSRKSII